MKWYLDFGHGGKDPWAIGPTNLKEINIALKIGYVVSVSAIPTRPMQMPRAILLPITFIAKLIPVPSTSEESEP